MCACYLQVAAEVQVSGGRRGLPADAIGPGTTYTPMTLPDGDSNVEVFVSNVINPSHFWLQLKGRNTSKALELLMDELE